MKGPAERGIKCVTSIIEGSSGRGDYYTYNSTGPFNLYLWLIVYHSLSVVTELNELVGVSVEGQAPTLGGRGYNVR